MFREAAELRPRSSRAAARKSRPASSSSERCVRQHGAARRRHLRARQLRPRGHLRQVPDRDPHGPAHLVRGAVGQLGLRVEGGPRGRPVPRDLAVGREPRPARCRGSGQGRRRARGRARQRRGLAARARRPSHHAAARRRRDQRRGHQVVHRLARRDRASGRELDRRTANCTAALEQAPDQLERAWQLDWSAAIEHASLGAAASS